MYQNLILGLGLFLSFQLFSQDVVINEINYKSSVEFAVGDWVELYNTLDTEKEVSAWVFKDEMDDHIFEFPAGTLIPAGGYLVLCKNDTTFTASFPYVSAYLGNFAFSLSGGGELIRLYDNNGNLIDQVTYDDVAPWPTEPDGNGPSLELINPSLDNTLALSWSASLGNGTPGVQNSSFVGVQNISNITFSIFPNPAINSIRLEIPEEENIISIFDINGNIVLKETNKTRLQINKLNSGVYIVQVYTKDNIRLSRFVKI
jgi:hypothetical protein